MSYSKTRKKLQYQRSRFLESVLEEKDKDNFQDEEKLQKSEMKEEEPVFRKWVSKKKTNNISKMKKDSNEQRRYSERGEVFRIKRREFSESVLVEKYNENFQDEEKLEKSEMKKDNEAGYQKRAYDYSHSI